MTLPRGAVFPEFFQAETRCVSNHAACRCAEKALFFRSLRVGRRCVAASRFIFSKLKRSERVCAGQRRMRVPPFESGPAGAGESPENFCRHGRQYAPELTKGQARRVCPVALFVREAED